MYGGSKLELESKTFNRLTVLRRHTKPRDKNGKSLWICRCSCGTEKIIRGGDIHTGATQSCGCLAREEARKFLQQRRDAGLRTGRTPRDLTGESFGKLTVVSRAEHTNARHEPFWHCDCECGGKTVTNGSDLTRGRSKSCGCSRKQQGRT